MKSLAISISFLFLTLGSRAQAPNWDWANHSTGNAPASALTIDVNDNIFVTGYYSNTVVFGSTTLSSAGDTDIYITKYDAQGNVVWAQSVGNFTNNVAYGISTDAAGNFYILGSFHGPTLSFGTVTATGSGTGSTVFVAKYNTSGNALWVKTVQGNINFYGASIFSDANGNSFITGTFSSTLVLGSNTLTTSGFSSDMYYAKLNTLGQVVWVKQLNTLSFHYAFGINADLSGNIFLLGTYSNSVNIIGTDTLYNTSGNQDVFLAKCDALGNVLWARSMDAQAISIPYPNSITTDQSGNCSITGYFTGATLSLGTLTLSNSGAPSKLFLAKYDAAGNLLWARTESGVSLSRGTGVIADANGNLYVSGMFGYTMGIFGTLNLVAKGSPDLFVVKYDVNGNAIWGQTASGGIFSKGICKDGSGNLCVSGYYIEDSLICGTTTLTNSNLGIQPMFVAKLGSLTVGNNENNLELDDLGIYPNPASAEIRISVQGATKKLAIRIMDLSGREVYSYTIDQHEPKTLNISSLPSAMYIIEFEDESRQVRRKKLLKE